MIRNLLLCAVVALMGCKSAAYLTLSAVQAYTVGYQIYADGDFAGESAFNSTYIAVDAKVDAKLRYYAPVVLGEESVLVWEKEVAKDSGQRAYKIVFSNVDGQDFVQIIPSTWAEARTQLTHLSPADPEVKVAAEEASPKIPVAGIPES